MWSRITGFFIISKQRGKPPAGFCVSGGGASEMGGGGVMVFSDYVNEAEGLCDPNMEQNDEQKQNLTQNISVLL